MRLGLGCEVPQPRRRTALAQELEIVGAQPIPERRSAFQPAATELARDVQWLDNMLVDHHHE